MLAILSGKRKRRLIGMRTTLIVLLVCSVLGSVADAQVQPDAERLFRDAALHAFQSLPQLELTATIDMETDGLGSIRKEVSVVIHKPDQAFESVKTLTGTETAIVSDGMLWLHDSYYHLWDTRSAQLRPDSFLNLHAGGELLPRDFPLTQAEMAGQETLTIDGAAYACKKVEVTYRMPPGVDVDNVLWIDEESGVPLKQEVTFGGAKPLRTIVTVTRFRTAGPLPRDAFKRTPAKDSKQDSAVFDKELLTAGAIPAFGIAGLTTLAGEPFGAGSVEGQPALFVFEGPGCRACADEVEALDAATTTLNASSTKAFRVFVGDAGAAPAGVTLIATPERAEQLGVQILPATVPVSPDGRIGHVSEGAMTAAEMVRVAEAVRALPTEAQQAEHSFVLLGQSGVVAPVLIYGDPVVLTDRERALNVRGTVVLAVTVDRVGLVSDVFVQEGLDPALDAAAVEAVRRWTFRPGTRDGVPANVRFGVNINFK